MRRLLLICLMALMYVGVQAQTASDLRINEISVERDSTGRIVDAWIEIFNTSQSNVDMSRLYLSNDRGDLRKFFIPQGTTATQFVPRGFAVMKTDGRGDLGPLHTPFDLEGAEFIYLSESNGYTVIDSVAVPKCGVVARVNDGKDEWARVDKATCGFTNATGAKRDNAEYFMAVDPHGAGITATSVGVVFSVLFVLAVVFTLIGRLNVRLATKKSRDQMNVEAMLRDSGQDDSEAAAVAAVVALYLRDRNDETKGRLTILRQPNRHWKNSIKR